MYQDSIYSPIFHPHNTWLLDADDPICPQSYYLSKWPYSATSQNPTTSFHILNSTLTYTFSAKERDTETGYSVTSLRSVSSSSLSQAQTSLAWHSLIRRFGSRYYSSELSIWLSVDPMLDKYPSLSPYVYCANNPIKLVDPNGEEVYIIGDDVASALEQLQNQTSLKLSIGADGKLSYEGSVNSKIDMLIAQAVDDENITVNMITGKDKDFGDGNVINYGGGYGGNYYEDGKVCTEQFVCPSNLASLDKLVGDSKTGLTMVHELAESFFGGTIALSQKQSSPDSRYPNSTYLQAHKMANKIAGGDISHYPVFFKEKPSFIDDKAAKIFMSHIEIWKRGQK